MKKSFTIAQNTLRESLRSKVLYSLLLFAVLLIGVSIFFGSVTIGDQVKVIKDFGLFSISLFSVAYVIISGASLFHKEISRKTLHSILARPVSRFEFLCGKFLGLLLTATSMIVLMSACLFMLVLLMDKHLNLALLLSAYYVFLELLIVCAAIIFFSSIVVTPMLIGLFTFAFYLAGRSASLLLYLIDNNLVSGEPGRALLKGIYSALPHLEMLNISNEAVYELLPSLEHTLWATAYAFTYTVTLLIFARTLFEKREFL